MERRHILVLITEKPETEKQVETFSNFKSCVKPKVYPIIHLNQKIFQYITKNLASIKLFISSGLLCAALLLLQRHQFSYNN